MLQSERLGTKACVTSDSTRPARAETCWATFSCPAAYEVQSGVCSSSELMIAPR